MNAAGEGVEGVRGGAAPRSAGRGKEPRGGAEVAPRRNGPRRGTPRGLFIERELFIDILLGPNALDHRDD